MNDKLIQEAEKEAALLLDCAERYDSLNICPAQACKLSDIISQLLSALKAQEWQPIDHNNIDKYRGEYGLWSVRVKSKKNNESWWDTFLLSLDDEGSLQLKDKHGDYHTDWEFEDYEYYKPITTPEVKDKSDIFDNDEVVTHFLNTAAENQKDNK